MAGYTGSKLIIIKFFKCGLVHITDVIIETRAQKWLVLQQCAAFARD